MLVLTKLRYLLHKFWNHTNDITSHVVYPVSDIVLIVR